MSEANVNEVEIASTTTEENSNSTPSVTDLQAQIAEMQKQINTEKANRDKALSKAADLQKQLRQRMTEAEAQELANRELQESEKARVAEMEAELNRLKASSAYSQIADEKMVNTLIDAVGDKDHASIATLINQIVEAKVKTSQQEWLKSRPDVSVGGASQGITKEQFDKMGIADRTALKRENPSEYERLLNL